MSQVKDLFNQLFPTTDPNSAARGSSGEVIAEKPPEKERSSGDWLPIIAVAVGMAILALAFLRQEPASEPVDPRSQQGPQSSERPSAEDYREF